MRTKNPMAKKPQQILFSKNTFTTPRVKIEHWDFAVHAEKKDNYVYRDQLSNHLSSYVRWGTEDQGVRMTETRHMLAQIFAKTDPVYSFKPLVNFTSYPCTDTPGRNKLMKNADLAQLPPDFGIMDYLTSQQDDYRNPFPSVTKPSFWPHLLYSDNTFRRGGSFKKDLTFDKCALAMATPTWLLNRVIRSDLTHNHGTAPPRGNYQCLDTHTPIGHIRQMRLFRYQSFDPATCVQDFPTLNKSLDTN